MVVNNIYCFVDETGQDTEGKLFLVVVVIIKQDTIDLLETKLLQVEKDTAKNILKWTKTVFEIKKNYIQLIANLPNIKNTVYYSVYTDTKEYPSLTTLTIAKAINNCHITNTKSTVIIDGLRKQEIQKVRIELKQLHIPYKIIKGLKDEQSVFLRFADSIAGLLRDSEEKQHYTKMLVPQLVQKKIVTKLN